MWASSSQEESSHQNPTMMVPWSWTYRLYNCEKKTSVVHPSNLWYFVMAAQTKAKNIQWCSPRLDLGFRIFRLIFLTRYLRTRDYLIRCLFSFSLLYKKGFPGSSAGKESTFNAGDPGLIPGLGRSPGGGIDYPLQCSWIPPVTQMVKTLPALWETWVRSLGWEDPLEKGMVTHSNILAWRIPWTEEPGWLQCRGSQRVRHHWEPARGQLLARAIFLTCRQPPFLCIPSGIPYAEKGNWCLFLPFLMKTPAL